MCTRLLPAEKPSSCSHFLEVMDAAAAQWQHAVLRGTGVNSAQTRRRCRTVVRRLPQERGMAVTLAVGTPCPLLRALSLSGLCTGAVLNVPSCITPGSYPASQVFLNQRQKFVSFFFFACLSRTACFVMFYVISAPSPVSAICCGKEFSTAVCVLKRNNTDQLDTLVFPSTLEDN